LRTKSIDAGAKLLEPGTSLDLQRSAIESLGATADPAAAAALVGAYPKLSSGMRDLALAQLFKRGEWTTFLIDELEAKHVKPNDLGPNALFRLRTHPDKAVAKKANGVLDAILGTQNKAKNQIIEALFPQIEPMGNVVKGKALFTENCMKCHGYKGEGRSIAPDLTGMGIHGKHELLVSVIDPNRVVETNYISFTCA